MKEYILKGDPAEIEKIIRENRIRVSRGGVTFTPVAPEEVLEPCCIETLKESHAIMEADCRRMTVAQGEMAGIIRELITINTENGHSISDELATRLEPFGIIVPKTEETVPNTEENPEKEADSVPKEPENDNPAMDEKHVELDDFVEVDLDSDDKTPVINDSKDVPADDSKETPTAKKTSKRSKKSE